MTLNVAVQMDHIAGINIAGDSTFALLLEAQRRGHALAHYTVDRLSLLDGVVSASVEPLTVRDEPGRHFALGPAARRPLGDFDVVLMRQDPPFDIAYVTATHLLEHVPATTRVVNDPKGVRDAPEKLFVTRFRALMPPTLITRDKAEIADFRKAHGDIVLKPLHGNGGAAVFRIRRDDENFGSFIDLFRTDFREPFVVQKYLPAIKDGDKRIILVDGAFAGALNRLPAPGDLRANLARGGSGHAADLTDREREICAAIGPALREHGLLFAGIDVIGGFLTEINVTSPTGLRAIARLGGADIAALIWDAIEGDSE